MQNQVKKINNFLDSKTPIGYNIVMNDKLNPGDIVKISEKINDDRMPKSRMGFIINKVNNLINAIKFIEVII